MYTATAVPEKGITVQACKHACMCAQTRTHAHTHARTHTHTPTHTHQPTNTNFIVQCFLETTINMQMLNQSKASHRHALCMHACKHMYIHPAHTHTSTAIPHIHTKIHKFMALAETSTFGIFDGRNVRGRNVLAEMSVAKTSVAEISYIPLVHYC